MQDSLDEAGNLSSVGAAQKSIESQAEQVEV